MYDTYAVNKLLEENTYYPVSQRLLLIDFVKKRNELRQLSVDKREH